VVRDDAGAVRYYEGTVEDITAQRRAQIETEANERRFRALTEKAPVVTVVCGEMGELSYASPAALSLGGVTGESMLGRNIFEWLHPDDVLARASMRACWRQHSGSPSIALPTPMAAGVSLAAVASNCLNDDAVRAG
jgi:PAS domain-containing protein